LREGTGANLAIVTAYNDMLSAHQPYARSRPRGGARGGTARPRAAFRQCGICGHPRRESDELSCSRATIAVDCGRPSHNMPAPLSRHLRQDCALASAAALSFGHLPAVFLPAGPMPSGLGVASRSRKSAFMQRGQAAPICGGEAEAYHAPGMHLRPAKPTPNSDADGDHGPASALFLRQSQYAAAGCPGVKRAARSMRSQQFTRSGAH
jgi:phosphogluconate dehydratase